MPRQVFAPASDPYYVELRKWFALDSRIPKARTELEKARALCASVHGRWRHSNDDEPTRNDPITILEEASRGRRFRCVQYAQTLSGALNAFGLPARVVSLMTTDVETRPANASHVVTEFWWRLRRKWVLLDAQENALLVREGEPQSAVEISQSIDDPSLKVEIPDLPSGVEPKGYLTEFGPNFFYFQTRLDQRPIPVTPENPTVMLVPLGSPKPKVFQWMFPFRNVTYTHSRPAFYRPPL